MWLDKKNLYLWLDDRISVFMTVQYDLCNSYWRTEILYSWLDNMNWTIKILYFGLGNMIFMYVWQNSAIDLVGFADGRILQILRCFIISVHIKLVALGQVPFWPNSLNLNKFYRGLLHNATNTKYLNSGPESFKEIFKSDYVKKWAWSILTPGSGSEGIFKERHGQVRLVI